MKLTKTQLKEMIREELKRTHLKESYNSVYYVIDSMAIEPGPKLKVAARNIDKEIKALNIDANSHKRLLDSLFKLMNAYGDAILRANDIS